MDYNIELIDINASVYYLCSYVLSKLSVMIVSLPLPIPLHLCIGELSVIKQTTL